MAIREVSLVLGYHAAGSAADNGKTSIFEGPTETAIFSGDMSQTGLQYKSAVLGRRRASGTKRPRTASLPERATPISGSSGYWGTRSPSTNQMTNTAAPQSQTVPATRQQGGRWGPARMSPVTLRAAATANWITNTATSRARCPGRRRENNTATQRPKP
jgi:hypothetical protein